MTMLERLSVSTHSDNVLNLKRKSFAKSHKDFGFAAEGYVKAPQNEMNPDIFDLSKRYADTPKLEAKPKPPNQDQSATCPDQLRHAREECCLTGFWEEDIEVGEDKFETRFRVARIKYSLMNRGITVEEPREANSGFDGGLQASTKQLPLYKEDGTEVGLADLRCGETITIHGRLYYICFADDFTKKTYADRGFAIGEECALPEKPNTSKEIRTPQQQWIDRDIFLREFKLRAASRNAKLKQFHDHDGEILRFLGFTIENNVVTHLVISYFLADNSVKMTSANNRIFAEREEAIVDLDPQLTPSLRGADGHMKLKPADFCLGKTVQLYAKTFYLYDCNHYTHAWYKNELSRTMEASDCIEWLRELNINCPPLWPSDPCGAIVSSDKMFTLLGYAERKLMRTVKFPGNAILEFQVARLDGTKDEQYRNYRLSFNLTLMLGDISEMKQPDKIRTRHGKMVLRRFPIRQKVEDLYIGNVLRINGAQYKLVRATEVCLIYMEQDPAAFPKSDLYLVLRKLCAIYDVLCKERDETGTEMEAEALKTLAKDRADIELVEQELITLERRFSPEGSSLLHLPRMLQEVEKMMPSN